MLSLRATTALGFVALAACTQSHAVDWCSDPAPSGNIGRAVTFHQDVEPIMVRACGRCHVQGGIAPFPLRSYADAAAFQGPIRAQVASRTMPPWPPAHCCAEYKRAAFLTDDEINTIVSWVDQGGVEGAPTADAGVPLVRTLSRVDKTLTMPEPYKPSPPPGKTDDTRCFMLDWNEAATQYVTGLDIKPGQPSEVHHALVMVATADKVAGLQALDDAEPGPGWSCPGGIAFPFIDYLGGWSPGWDAEELPDGIGHQVNPGSKLVLTVHYSKHADPNLVADQTSVLVKMQADPVTQVRSLAVFNAKWVAGGMRIPAHSDDVVFRYAFDPSVTEPNKKITVYDLDLHMHEHGKSGGISIVRKNGSDECLLRIPRWDHTWQGNYTLATPRELALGDQVSVECDYANTGDTDLTWAEDQEMCVGFLTVTDTDR